MDPCLIFNPSGFKHEGNRREALWKEGKWVDMILMGLLSKEYHATGQTSEEAQGWWVLL